MGQRFALIGLILVLLIPPVMIPQGRVFCSPISLTWVHATVRVENEWGKGGTGFLVIRKMTGRQGKVFLVTNKHVIHPDLQAREKALFLTLYLNVREKDGTVLGKSFQVPLTEDDHKLWREHPHPSVDVLAVDVTSLINGST